MGTFFYRLMIRCVVVLQILYSIFPSWSWAMGHGGEVFEVDLTEAGRLALRYQVRNERGVCLDDRQGAWALERSVVSAPPHDWQVTLLEGGLHQFQWIGSPSTRLSFSVKPDGSLVLGATQGAQGISLKTRQDLVLPEGVQASADSLYLEAGRFFQEGTMMASHLGIAAHGGIFHRPTGRTRLLTQGIFQAPALEISGKITTDQGAWLALKGQELVLRRRTGEVASSWGVDFSAVHSVRVQLDDGGTWGFPVSLPGTFAVSLDPKARRPLHLQTLWRADQGIRVHSPSQPFQVGDALASGFLESSQGSLTVQASSVQTAPNSSLTAGQDVTVESATTSLFHGRLHGGRDVVLTAGQSLETHAPLTAGHTLQITTGRLTYDPYQLMAQHRVFLWLTASGEMTQPLDVPGHLRVQYGGAYPAPLTILTSLKGASGVEITDLPPTGIPVSSPLFPRQKIVFGKAGGPEATLSSDRGDLLIEGGNLHFLQGSLYGHGGITVKASREIIQGQGTAEKRKVSFSYTVNGWKSSGTEMVNWMRYSPVRWQSDADLIFRAPWIELNGGQVWTRTLHTHASGSASTPTAVIHQGVTLDVLGDGVIEAPFFFHGMPLQPAVNHRLSLQLQSLPAGPKMGVGGTVSPQRGHIPAGEISTLSVDGTLDLRVRRGRNVASLITAGALIGQTPLTLESLIPGLQVEGHPHYQAGKHPLPQQSAATTTIFHGKADVNNQGTLHSPLLELSFSALRNGVPPCGILPLKAPDRPLRVDLLDFFRGASTPQAQGPSVLNPFVSPLSPAEGVPPASVIDPHRGFQSPAALRFLFDPLTESRLLSQSLLTTLGRQYLKAGETPWQTWMRLRHNTQTWQNQWHGASSSGQALALPSSSTHVAQAMAQATEPLLLYVPTMMQGEIVASPSLYLPPQWGRDAPHTGFGVISGQHLLLAGDATAPITNTGQIFARDKGVLTGGTLTQTKAIEYGTRPAAPVTTGHGALILPTTAYQPRWGGELLGGTWTLDLSHLSNHLGWIDVDNLWLSAQSAYNSGRIAAQNVCLYEVGTSLHDRQQRSWSYTLQHTEHKSSWWGLKKSSRTWTQTVVCRESYPAPLSGFLGAGRLTTERDDALSDLFDAALPPLAEPPLHRFTLRGGTILTGPGGLSATVRSHLETLPLIDTTVHAYAISHRGRWGRSFSETGAIQRHSVLVPAMVSEGSLEWRSHQTMSLQSLHAEVRRPGHRLTFQARGDLVLGDTPYWQPVTPAYHTEKGAVFRVSGAVQQGAVPHFSNPHGPVTLRSETGTLSGVVPEGTSLTLDAPQGIALTPPQRAQALTMTLLDDGQLNPRLQMALGLTAGVVSAGTLAPAVVSALNLTSTAATVATAGVSTLTSQFTAGMMTHHGQVGRALDDLGRPHAVRQMATSLVTAGLTHTLSEALQVNLSPQLTPSSSLEDFFRASLFQTAVSVPVHITLGRTSPQEALRQGLRTTLAQTAGAYGAFRIGQAYGRSALTPRTPSLMNPVTHKLVHGLLGGATGSLLSKDPTRGAVAGALGALVAETTAETLVPRNTLVTSPDQLASTVHYARFIAGTVALATGQNMDVALQTAQTAVENNFVPMMLTAGKILWEVYATTHEEELDALKKDLAQWVAEKTDWDAETVEQTYDVLLMAGSTGNALRKGANAVLRKITTHVAHSSKTLKTGKSLTIEKGAKIDEQLHQEFVKRFQVKSSEQPWTVRPGQEWKTKIIGRAQKTQTEGHDVASYRKAIKAAKKAETEAALLNRGVKRATGEPISPNTRPDVAVVKKDGKVYQVEVPSKSDQRRVLQKRMNDATKKFSLEKQGENKIIEIKKPDQT